MESENTKADKRDDNRAAAEPRTASLIDWFHQGESKQVEANGVLVTVRFVGRKGPRGRIAIEAPPGAVFRAVDGGDRKVTNRG